MAFATGTRAEGKDNHRFYKKSITREAQRSPQPAKPQGWNTSGQLLRPWAETRAAYRIHAVYSSTRSQPVSPLGWWGMTILVLQILADVTGILWQISRPRGCIAVRVLKDFHPIPLACAHLKQWVLGAGRGQLHSGL